MSAPFRPATPDDDADLRDLLRSIEMPGAVRLTLEREPSFVAADAALGPAVQTLVAHGPDGRAVALVSRAVRTVWVGGRPTRAALIGGLRVRPGYRTGRLLADGWTALRALHDADPTPLVLLAVTAENDRAHRLLRLHRGDAPAVRPVADLVTLALVVHRGHRGPAPTDRAAADALRQRLGPARDLFPADPLALPGLGEGDDVVVWRGGEPVGALALWDPAAVRQTVVRGYGRALAWARPLVNAAARVVGARPLPRIGAPLRSAFAVRPVARDGRALDRLLGAALAEARGRGLAFVLVGFDARDPALPRVRRRPHIPYRSVLYAAHWPDAPPPPLAAPVHAEIASL